MELSRYHHSWSCFRRFEGPKSVPGETYETLPIRAGAKCFLLISNDGCGILITSGHHTCNPGGCWPRPAPFQPVLDGCVPATARHCEKSSVRTPTHIQWRAHFLIGACRSQKSHILLSKVFIFLSPQNLWIIGQFCLRVPGVANLCSREQQNRIVLFRRFF